jgi:hypothetical protein
MTWLVGLALAAAGILVLLEEHGALSPEAPIERTKEAPASSLASTTPQPTLAESALPVEATSTRLVLRAVGVDLLGDIEFEVRPAPDRTYGQPGPSRPWRRIDHDSAEVIDVAPNSRWVVGARSSDGRLVGNSVVEFPEDAQEHEVTVGLVVAAVVEGRVIDPAGAPVAGAEVRAWMPGIHPRPTFTGPDGTFVLADCVDDVALGAHASGFAPAYEVVRDVPPGGRKTVALELGTPWVLRGIALDGDGKPVQGTLMAWTCGEGEYASTGPDGRFSFPGLPREGMNLVVEWKPKPSIGVRQRLRLGPPPRGRDVLDVGTLRLGPSYLQQVRVVDTFGDSLPAVGVVHGAGPTPLHTDPDGHTALWLGPGRHVLRLAGFTAGEEVEVTVGSLEVPKPVTLVATDAFRVAGRVSYAGEDEPELEGLDLRARKDPTEVWRYGRAERGGRFAFAVPIAWRGGPIEIQAGEEPNGWNPPFWVMSTVHGMATGDSIEVKISPTDVMGAHIRAVEKDGTTPVTRFRVGLGPPGTWQTGYFLTPSGTCDYFPLRPGAARIRIGTPDGRGGDSGDVTLKGGPWPVVTVVVDP